MIREIKKDPFDERMRSQQLKNNALIGPPKPGYVRVFKLTSDFQYYKGFEDIEIIKEYEYFFDGRGVIIGAFCPCCDGFTTSSWFDLIDGEEVELGIAWFRCLAQAENKRMEIYAKIANGEPLLSFKPPYVLVEVKREEGEKMAEIMGKPFTSVTEETDHIH